MGDNDITQGEVLEKMNERFLHVVRKYQRKFDRFEHYIKRYVEYTQKPIRKKRILNHRKAYLLME